MAPKISTSEMGIFTLPPKLSFDSEDDGLKDEVGLSVNDKTSLLATSCMERFATLKHKWTKTFLEVEAGYSAVVKDLKQLQTYASGCKRLIGHPDVNDAGERTTLWSKIYQLGDILRNQNSDVEPLNTTTSGKLLEVQHKQDALRHELQIATMELESSTRGLEEVTQTSLNRIAVLEATLAEYEKRFQYILLILLEVKRQGQPVFPPTGSPSVSSLTLASLQEQLRVLTSKVDNCSSIPA